MYMCKTIYELRVYVIHRSHPLQKSSLQWWQVTTSLVFPRLNSLPGWVALHSEVQTTATDWRRLSEDGCLTWYPWDLRRVALKQDCWPKHSTQTRRSLLLSPWDACPYIKMWFGALTKTQQGEAGWEGLGLQCKPQTHSLPPALPSCSQLYYIHSCRGVCVWCLCMCCVFGKRGFTRSLYRSKEVEAEIEVTAHDGDGIEPLCVLKIETNVLFCS